MFDSDAKTYARMAPHMQRVLIVDPHPASVRLLSDLLRDVANSQIWSAPSIDKGMELAKSVAPQIVFAEQSALLDGIAFAKAMRRSDYHARKAPVIMMTAEATAATIIGARDAGVHEFLRKPFTIKDLVRRLEAVTLRGRDWIEAVGYIGPDRRRFNSGDYSGPLKRMVDHTATPDQVRLVQAIKILRASVAAIELDRKQALRSMVAQGDELQRCAIALKNLRLAAIAGDLQRHLAGVTPVTLAAAPLEPLLSALAPFVPAENQPGAAAA